MIKWSPFRSILLTYLFFILFGSILLRLPIAGRDISFIDSLFTSTSAMCVTGLIVKDTALDFTFFGKAVILSLIQIGGMGYMAIASLFMTVFAIRPDKRQNIVVQQGFALFGRGNTLKFLRTVVLVTFIVEMIGAFFFFLGFNKSFVNNDDRILHAIFHSVSAFCNAGFSSFSDNLMGFTNSLLIPLVTAFLLIFGGLGFIVIIDIIDFLRREKKYLSEHSRIVLYMTMLLIIFGTLSIFILEYGNAISPYKMISKIVISFFTAVTPRTAGFTLLDLNKLLPTTILILILFMFIGASPGGTGGGIKTTTFTITLVFFISKIRGMKSVNIQKRQIPEEQVNKALTLFLISLILISIIISILSFTERELVKERGFLPIVFEEFSAFGTVGLSMGSLKNGNLSLSYDFTNFGKILIIITMLTGRIGPLSLLAAVFERRSESFQYPPARVQIG
ncbi:MAG: TrkH family potassium uptake protein [candidate division WOR-3 bacterium]